MFGRKWQWQMYEHHCCFVLHYFLLIFLLESVYIKKFQMKQSIMTCIMVLSRRRMFMLMVVLNGFWFWSLFGRQTYYQKCTILLIFYIIAWNNRRSLFLYCILLQKIKDYINCNCKQPFKDFAVKRPMSNHWKHFNFLRNNISILFFSIKQYTNENKSTVCICG